MRYFTLVEANRTLPLVKRIVSDIAGVYPKWRELVAQYEVVAAGARPEWGESPEQIRLKSEIDAVARDIAGFIKELEQIGCVFKGVEQGLVDFRGRLDDKDIFWCWKLGEERIEHWHDLESGYAGRQPVPEIVS